jgi:heat shock protein HslJ
VFPATPNGKIAIQLTTATQIAGAYELMKLERKYFDALSHVKQILLKSDRIILENEATSLDYTFNRARWLWALSADHGWPLFEPRG